MNIALGAVLIFILLIPPVAFYISYTFGQQARGGLRFSFLDGILASAIFSLLVHGLAILFMGKEIRFDILLKMVGGELKDLENKIPNSEFTKSLQQFAWYNFVVLVIMVFLGQFIRRITRLFKLDNKFELLRIYNNWWYLFNGYYLEEEEYVQLAYDTAPVADVIADTNAGTVIYSGMLVGYVCNGEDLDRIYLRGAVRRDFKMNAERRLPTEADSGVSDIKEIPGQFICIAYSQIKNINLRFITVDATEEYIEEFEDIPDDTEDAIETNDTLNIDIHSTEGGKETTTKESI